LGGRLTGKLQPSAVGLTTTCGSILLAEVKPCRCVVTDDFGDGIINGVRKKGLID
jgi:hypothetical protein